MSRRSISPFQALLGACVFTLILALLPARMLGWVNDLAAIVRLPAVPVTDVATRLRVWLAGGPHRNGPATDDVEFLSHELDRYRVLAEEWRQLADEYARIIAQLQNTQRFGLNVPYTPVIANIIARNTHGRGMVYSLNVGSHRYNLVPNSVAVYEGAHLIGRISAVTRLQSDMVPITDGSFALVRAVVSPGSDDTAEQRPVPLHLENRGDGTFTGEVPRDAGVAVGDSVHLSDPSWPRTAQALIIGTVASKHTDERNPLLERVVVRPVFDAARLSSVTIKVERAGSPDDPIAPEQAP